MDRVTMQQMLQANASKNESETIKYAANVVGNRMKVLRTKLEEEKTASDK